MYFDQMAREWDNDPDKDLRAKTFAKEIHDFIRPDKKMDALEFGCGTGTLSFHLKDFFNTITLVDNSPGMIEVLKEKIDHSGIENLVPHLTDLSEKDLGSFKAEVVYTLMALHHVPDIRKTLTAFHSILQSGGFLCIGDLVKEDGSFHAHMHDFDGHHGFDREDLEDILLHCGFTAVYYNECFVIEKTDGTKVRQYPLFLMIARKS